MGQLNSVPLKLGLEFSYGYMGGIVQCGPFSLLWKEKAKHIYVGRMSLFAWGEEKHKYFLCFLVVSVPSVDCSPALDLCFLFLFLFFLLLFFFSMFLLSLFFLIIFNSHSHEFLFLFGKTDTFSPVKVIFQTAAMGDSASFKCTG